MIYVIIEEDYDGNEVITYFTEEHKAKIYCIVNKHKGYVYEKVEAEVDSDKIDFNQKIYTQYRLLVKRLDLCIYGGFVRHEHLGDLPDEDHFDCIDPHLLVTADTLDEAIKKGQIMIAKWKVIYNWEEPEVVDTTGMF